MRLGCKIAKMYDLRKENFLLNSEIQRSQNFLSPIHYSLLTTSYLTIRSSLKMIPVP